MFESFENDDGSRVASRWAITGKNNGVLGTAPDQRPIRFTGTTIGAVRNFANHDGDHLREQLLALSDHAHSFTYQILESPFPVANYVSTLQLQPITESNASFAT